MASEHKESPTDLDWISTLASALAGAGRGEALQILTELLVARCILVDNVGLSDEERAESLAEEIEERLRCCRSDTFAHEMFSTAANNDPDFEQFLFPDGRGEMIFMDDSEIEVTLSSFYSGTSITSKHIQITT